MNSIVHVSNSTKKYENWNEIVISVNNKKVELDKSIARKNWNKAMIGGFFTMEKSAFIYQTEGYKVLEVEKESKYSQN